MPTTTGFRDIDNAVALDIATKFVTKEYLMEFYPDLVPAALTPRLFTWGDNSKGQLGTNNTTSSTNPVETVSRGTNWKQVAFSNSPLASSFAAIKTDGTLWTCGDNTYGQLGTNNTSSRSSPVQITGAGTTWRQVACGGRHMSAVKTDGTLWSWGTSDFGQLGQSGANSPRSSPVTTSGGGTTWKQVACALFHTAAIKTDGTLWTCGYGSFGNLGDGTSSSRSSPVTTAGGGTTWKQVAAGGDFCAAVKTDGTLWTWGRNTTGNLGDNTSSNRSSPVTTVAGGTNWKQVACGNLQTAAIKTDGTLWTWGSNQFGVLGDNTSSTSSKSSPVSIAGGGTNWRQVACGYTHMAAVKTDGTLWTWGNNVSGSLGNNTSSPRSSPVTPVVGSLQPYAIYGWKQVTGGRNNTAAINESEGW